LDISATVMGSPLIMTWARVTLGRTLRPNPIYAQLALMPAGHGVLRNKNLQELQ